MSLEKNEKSLIYVLDGNESTRKLSVDSLKENGFEVSEFSNGNDLLAQAEKKIPDLFVLDWKMPEGPDGLTICGRIKVGTKTRNVPIMMLNSGADDSDVTVALQMGADDYLKRPFNVTELLARIKALLRGRGRLTRIEIKDKILSIGEIKLNLGNRTTTKRGKFISLTMKEFDLFAILIEAGSRVLTREYLMGAVWSPDFGGDARTVDVHIRYLRQKIEDCPDSPVYVKTVRGIGYRVASEDELKEAGVSVDNVSSDVARGMEYCNANLGEEYSVAAETVVGSSQTTRPRN